MGAVMAGGGRKGERGLGVGFLCLSLGRFSLCFLFFRSLSLFFFVFLLLLCRSLFLWSICLSSSLSFRPSLSLSVVSFLLILPLSLSSRPLAFPHFHRVNKVVTIPRMLRSQGLMFDC